MSDQRSLDFDPDTVLQLIARLRGAEERVRIALEAKDWWMDKCNRAAAEPLPSETAGRSHDGTT